MVVAIAVTERTVMAVHFCRLLAVTARDLVLLRDAGKLALAALAAGLGAEAVRWFLGRESAWVVLGACGVTFASIYLAIVYLVTVASRLPLPLASRATSVGVSSR